MLGEIEMPRKVGVRFGNQAVAWAGIICLLRYKGCGTEGDIIDDANSLTLVGGDTRHSVLINIALLPSKDL